MEFDIIQKKIELDFELILDNIYYPVTKKLKELNIWSGDESFISIDNYIDSATLALKNNFVVEDVNEVNNWMIKYIKFRKETNSNFYCLQMILFSLDRSLNNLFEYFRDSEVNDFQQFQIETIQCSSIEEAIKLFNNSPSKNVSFSFPLIERNVNLSENKSQKLHLDSQQFELFSSSFSSKKSSYEEAIYRLNALKHIIENKNGHKIFEKIENQNEFMFQSLFKIICQGSIYDINSEVNNGRGPVDFTVSKGTKDKTIIEFKLAKNPKLKQNIKHQVEIYKIANETTHAVVGIIYFEDSELEKTLKVIKELNLEDNQNIILIDSRNKLSASRVKS